MSRASPVAVIDIGSNSIKLLVAAHGGGGALIALTEAIEETRIGEGINSDKSGPKLQEDAMQSAVNSIRNLLCEANRFSPAEVRIVATSAVREASNQAAFADFVDESTNHELRILTGDEEARYIASGVRCDDRLPQAERFYLFDLGGGSLELLAIERGEVAQLCSLPLGCVRLTQKFVPDPAAALAPETIAAIRAHARAMLHDSGFRFDLPAPAVAVVTGGTARTFRAVRAAAGCIAFDASEPTLPVAEIGTWALRFSGQNIAERRQVAGLSAARADIFPAALWTLVEIAGAAAVTTLHHSMHNLRYGLAAELLFGAK